MALRPTTPHDLSRFALARLHWPSPSSSGVSPCVQLVAPSPSSLSILSDAWRPSSRSLPLDLIHAANMCYDRKLWLPCAEHNNDAACARARAALTGDAVPLPPAADQQLLPGVRFLEPPAIAWIDPLSLIPHEHVDLQHLRRLIEHLGRLDPHEMLPTIIATRSHPHVILDGHHRWQASIAMKIERVPCWLVDDEIADGHSAAYTTLLPVPRSQFWNATQVLMASDIQQQQQQQRRRHSDEEYDYYKLRVYDTTSDTIIRIRDIAQRARSLWWQSRELQKQQEQQERLASAREDDAEADEIVLDDEDHPLTLSTRRRSTAASTGPSRAGTRHLRGNNTVAPDTARSKPAVKQPQQDSNAFAAGGGVSWGIKGTKHVAIHTQWPRPASRHPQRSSGGAVCPTSTLGSPATSPSSLCFPTEFTEEEMRLERVAPRIEWGLWRLSAHASNTAQEAQFVINAVTTSSTPPIEQKRRTERSSAVPSPPSLPAAAVVGYYGQGYITSDGRLISVGQVRNVKPLAEAGTSLAR
ncbi:hypothetical protein RI367_003017 [Sorochytrium milnesiophthora]